MLQHLENNEAILLMYLAGELPAEDVAEVEGLLASDAGLRAGYERLRRAHDTVMATLAASDAATLPPVREELAARQVSRMMLQWQVDRLASPAAPAAARPATRYPWWAYPAATAASVLIVFLVWWGRQPDVALPSDGAVATTAPVDGDEAIGDSDGTMAGAGDPFGVAADAAVAGGATDDPASPDVQAPDPTAGEFAMADDELSYVEQQLKALDVLRQELQ